MTERTRAMQAHPAGKGRALEDLPELHELEELADIIAMAPVARRQDQQEDWEELLAHVISAPWSSFEEAASETYFGALDLLMQKQAAYGPKAISGSPGGAINGINVRMHDKLSRAINLADRPTVPEYESLLDTYRDVANYAVIAVLVLEGKWPTS